MKKEKKEVKRESWKNILGWILLIIGIILLVIMPACSGCIQGAKCAEQSWIYACKIIIGVIGAISIVFGILLIAKFKNRKNNK